MKKRSDPKSNVQLLCRDCAPKSTKAWKHVDPESLVGCFVKKAFPAISPTGKRTRETMWVSTSFVRGKKIWGTLSNYPVFEMDLEYGDTVGVAMHEIIDVVDKKGKKKVPPGKIVKKAIKKKGVKHG